MASGYKVDGVDLDDILELRGSRTPSAGVTGIKVSGTDLNDRYLSLNHPDSIRVQYNLGYKVSGQDIGNIFSSKVPFTRYRLGSANTPFPGTGSGLSFARGACISKNGSFIAGHKYYGYSNCRINFWYKETSSSLVQHSSLLLDTIEEEIFISLDNNATRLAVLNIYAAASGDERLRIYTRSGTTWTIESVITFYYSPRSLFMDSSGTRIFIGAIDTSDTVVVYVRSGTTWSVEQTITSPNPHLWRRFGNSISSNGSRLVIGEPVVSGAPDDKYGRIHIFNRSGSTWTLSQTFISDDPYDYDKFGFSVSMNTEGNKILVGQPSTVNGKAWYYIRTGETWAREGNAISPLASASQTGHSVAIGDNGSFASGGVFSPSFGGGVILGSLPHASIRNLNLLRGDNSVVDNNFGFNVEASADFKTLMVTEPNGVETNNRTGLLYVYLYT